jgi:DNA-binding transcriptional LysR family regulator
MLEPHAGDIHMRRMNWGAFDLNLLIVFDAVMQERSVTKAGSQIGLSQPAMSHALSRLRYMLKDELFVRTPDGMVPTPRAESLAGPLRHALSEMQNALEPTAFDPRASDRRFALAVNNYSAIVVVPPLVAAAAAAAPSVQLDLRPSGTLDVLERLDRGDIDLALGPFGSAPERFAASLLLKDTYVIVMRRGHPAGRRKLTPTAFAALSHLEISSSFEDISFIDSWLAEHNQTRRIALRAPILSAAQIIVQSDLVVTLTRRVAEEFIRNLPLQISPAPYPSPELRTAMLWHRRLERLPAHRWLRDTIASVATTL